MKKNNHLKIIQINGLRGLLLTFFIISCVIAGFVGFPALLTMHTWNFFAAKTAMPLITIYEGLLLWAIIVLGVILFGKRKLIVSFNTSQELTDEEVGNVISRVKAQPFHSGMLKPDEFNFSNEKKEENDLQSKTQDK
jgi:hypothetical protein